MFTRSCGASGPHTTHTYTHKWKKRELDFLKDPESYPDEWVSGYICPGVQAQAWKLTYLHEDCAECEGCAEAAVGKAAEDETQYATFQIMVPVQHPAGVFPEVDHMGSAVRA